MSFLYSFIVYLYVNGSGSIRLRKKRFVSANMLK